MAVNYSNKRGIFTVSDVRLRQNSGYWPGGYAGYANYGYYGPGQGPSGPAPFDFFERIDFSNDTVGSVQKASSISVKSYGLAGNKNYAWLGGGVNPAIGGTDGVLSSVYRLDYSNDNSALVAAANFGPGSPYQGSFYHAATGNQDFGFHSGGGFPSPTNISRRIDYSNDTAAPSNRGSLSLARRLLAATGTQNFGYWAGGYAPAPVRSTIDRLTYTSDTATFSPKGPLSSTRYGLSGCGNRDYAWWGGSASSGNQSNVDRTDYSNDTATTLPRGNLSVGHVYGGSCSNQSYGYFGGGPATRIIDRVDFSNDTATASPKGSMNAKFRHSGVSGVQFDLPQTSNSEPYPAGTNFGYTASGNPSYYPSSTTSVTQVQRLNFSNDTTQMSYRAFTPFPKVFTSSSASLTHGYVAGGANPAFPGTSGYASDVQRISFSDDSVAATPRGPLAFIQYRTAGGGNTNYMWVAGGNDASPATISSVSRIDYSNDSATASPRGNLNRIVSQDGMVGNQNYGYWGGGDPSFSAVSRIDYSNDGVTASPKGTLQTGYTGTAGASNSDYGWFAGGYVPSLFASSSKVVRIDFSNDTGTHPNRSNLSAARYQHGATGNSSYGYWIGGASGRSILDRVDYSNDTATASLRSSVRNPVSANSGFSAGNHGSPQ